MSLGDIGHRTPLFFFCCFVPLPGSNSTIGVGRSYWYLTLLELACAADDYIVVVPFLWLFSWGPNLDLKTAAMMYITLFQWRYCFLCTYYTPSSSYLPYPTCTARSHPKTILGRLCLHPRFPFFEQ